MGVYENINGSQIPIASNLRLRNVPIEGLVTEEELLQGLATKNDVFQYETMPTASVDLVGKVVQYVGETTASYTNGYFYECVSDGAVTPSYSWVEKSVQSGSGEVDSDDVKIPSGLTELFNINHTTVDSWLSTYITFADGVLTEKAHPTGIIGAHYQITDADLVDYDLRAKIKVNVVSVSGEWTCRLEYLRYDGTKASWAIPFGTITQAGEIVLEIDLANLSVYGNYAGGGVDFRVMNVSHGENDTVVINAIDTLVGKELDLSGDNVTEVLETLSTGLDDVSVDVTNIKSKGLSLPAPNGNMFKIEVANDGTLATALDYPDNILYIGNSLLLGFGTHGMASTTVNDDYYAKLNAFIESKGIILTTDRVLANDFEGATDDTSAQTWITNNLASKMSSNVKMVLIQIGDNVNTYQQREQFPSSMELLVNYLRQNCPNAKIAWVGCWYSGSSIDNVLIPNCRALDVPFVSIDGLFSVEGNQSYIGATYIDASGNEKTITTAGQASHPSDQGFTAITNRIIEDLFTADSSTRGAESSRKSTVVRVSALPTASADFLNQTYLLTSPQTGYTEGGIYKCVAKGTNPETYEWKMINNSVPTGGQTGQVLVKKSSEDYDAEWEDAKSSLDSLTLDMSACFEPAPVQIIHLFENEERTRVGITYSIQDDICSFRGTATSSFLLWTKLFKAGTYTLNVDQLTGTGFFIVGKAAEPTGSAQAMFNFPANSASVTFTLDADYYLRFALYKDYTIDRTFRIWANEGSVPLPYSNITLALTNQALPESVKELIENQPVFLSVQDFNTKPEDMMNNNELNILY